MKHSLSKLLLKLIVVAASHSVAGAQTLRLPAVAPHFAPTGTTESTEIRFQPTALQQPFAGELPAADVLPPGSGTTLQELEQLATTQNPAIAQADARIRALRGRLVQVGLPPNPSAGYLAAEIGDEGRAGQQGGFVGQELITGGKLRLNRAVVAQEIQRAEQLLAAMQLRVQTDVRKSYYAALIAQRRTDLAADLVRVSGEAVKASQELLQAEEIPRAGLLQTQVEQQSAAILEQAAQNEKLAAWRRLSAVVGSELNMGRLSGDVGQLPGLLDWSEQLIRVTSTSPEASAALADLAGAQVALERARVEPVPDISTQFVVQFDNATQDTIAGVQLGMPLPIWNRNQGGIRQAEAEITQARRNMDRVELDLKQRLSIAFQEYTTARSQAEAYSTQILPKSKETFELVQNGYRQGELGYLDLLTAQRTYSQTNLAYLEALGILWKSWVDIEGLLLSDSLATTSQQ